MAEGLVLSLFPGIGLLDRAFEEEGYCIVRGPDVLWGGDVRRFHPPNGASEGIIGGPPCQSFSALAHLIRANGHEPRFGNLIPEFERVVSEAEPAWFVMENVPAAPEPVVPGYVVHTQVFNNRWLGEEQNRVRRISFGTRDGRHLHIEIAALEAPITYVAVKGDPRPTRREKRSVISGNGFDSVGDYYKRSVPSAVTSSDGSQRVKMVRYSLADACRLQGLPDDFLADAPFTADGKLKAVANGVPIPMGRAIARAVKRAMAAW